MFNIDKIKKNKALYAFLKRMSIFFIIFLTEIYLVSSLIKLPIDKITSLKILTGVDLEVYIILLLVFIIFPKELMRIKKINNINYYLLGGFLSLNLVALYGFFKLNKYIQLYPLIANQSPFLYTILWWTLGLAVIFSLAIALFGLDYLKYFTNTFKKELSIFAVLTFFVVTLSKLSQKLWPFFSKLVAKNVFFLLDLFFEGAVFSMEGYVPIIGIPSIIVKIGPPCSGLEGMALFLFAFTCLVLIERENLDKKKVFLLYPLGLFGAFLINTIRMFSILLVGHYTSVEFAVGAFHSNVGWVLFTIYFLSFVYFAYPWMKQRKMVVAEND